jgi:hypothetical protein
VSDIARYEIGSRTRVSARDERHCNLAERLPQPFRSVYTRPCCSASPVSSSYCCGRTSTGETLQSSNTALSVAVIERSADGLMRIVTSLG